MAKQLFPELCTVSTIIFKVHLKDNIEFYIQDDLTVFLAGE